MNDIWSILGIDPTDDKKAIRRAFAAQSRLHHPEEEPEYFAALNQAYKAALDYGAGTEKTPFPADTFNAGGKHAAKKGGSSALFSSDDRTGALRTGEENNREPLQETGEEGKSREPLQETGEEGKSREPLQKTGEEGKSREPLQETGEEEKSRELLQKTGKEEKSREPLRKTGEEGKDRELLWKTGEEEKNEEAPRKSGQKTENEETIQEKLQETEVSLLDRLNEAAEQAVQKSMETGALHDFIVLFENPKQAKQADTWKRFFLSEAFLREQFSEEFGKGLLAYLSGQTVCPGDYLPMGLLQELAIAYAFIPHFAGEEYFEGLKYPKEWYKVSVENTFPGRRYAAEIFNMQGRECDLKSMTGRMQRQPANKVRYNAFSDYLAMKEMNRDGRLTDREKETWQQTLKLCQPFYLFERNGKKPGSGAYESRSEAVVKLYVQWLKDERLPEEVLLFLYKTLDFKTLEHSSTRGLYSALKEEVLRQYPRAEEILFGEEGTEQRIIKLYRTYSTLINDNQNNYDKFIYGETPEIRERAKTFFALPDWKQLKGEKGLFERIYGASKRIVMPRTVAETLVEHLMYGDFPEPERTELTESLLRSLSTEKMCRELDYRCEISFDSTEFAGSTVPAGSTASAGSGTPAGSTASAGSTVPADSTATADSAVPADFGTSPGFVISANSEEIPNTPDFWQYFLMRGFGFRHARIRGNWEQDYIYVNDGQCFLPAYINYIYAPSRAWQRQFTGFDQEKEEIEAPVSAVCPMPGGRRLRVEFHYHYCLYFVSDFVNKAANASACSATSFFTDNSACNSADASEDKSGNKFSNNSADDFTHVLPNDSTCDSETAYVNEAQVTAPVLAFSLLQEYAEKLEKPQEFFFLLAVTAIEDSDRNVAQALVENWLRRIPLHPFLIPTVARMLAADNDRIPTATLNTGEETETVVYDEQERFTFRALVSENGFSIWRQIDYGWQDIIFRSAELGWRKWGEYTWEEYGRFFGGQIPAAESAPGRNIGDANELLAGESVSEKNIPGISAPENSIPETSAAENNLSAGNDKRGMEDGSGCPADKAETHKDREQLRDTETFACAEGPENSKTPEDRKAAARRALRRLRQPSPRARAAYSLEGMDIPQKAIKILEAMGLPENAEGYCVLRYGAKKEKRHDRVFYGAFAPFGFDLKAQSPAHVRSRDYLCASSNTKIKEPKVLVGRFGWGFKYSPRSDYGPMYVYQGQSGTFYAYGSIRMHRADSLDQLLADFFREEWEGVTECVSYEGYLTVSRLDHRLEYCYTEEDLRQSMHSESDTIADKFTLFGGYGMWMEFVRWMDGILEPGLPSWVNAIVVGPDWEKNGALTFIGIHEDERSAEIEEFEEKADFELAETAGDESSQGENTNSDNSPEEPDRTESFESDNLQDKTYLPQAPLLVWAKGMDRRDRTEFLTSAMQWYVDCGRFAEHTGGRNVKIMVSG